jgi:hypothetical protein
LRVFEVRLLRRIFELKINELKRCTTRSSVVCNVHHKLLGNKIKEGGMDEACSTYRRNEKSIEHFSRRPEGK